MTTFTTEDREWAFWHSYDTPKYNRQVEIEFFWPLTEQIGLDLNYEGCEKPKLTVLSEITGTLNYEFYPTTVSTHIAPTLSVQTQNSVGQLNIGGISVGLENEPKWYQKIVFKILGFNWKDSK
jgi:hypothetical protein